MVQKIGQITNANLYLNEVDLKGRVAEFDLGDFGSTEVEHKALGMIGVLKLPGRPVEAIEGKASFEWLDGDVEMMLLNPTRTLRFQLHSYVDVFDADGLNAEQSHTLITHVGCLPLKRSGVAGKLGEQMGAEHALSITYFMQKVYGAGTPIVEYDGFNQIYNVGGVPVWPT